MIDVIAAADSPEDARWRQWQAKGRADEARFRRTVKTVLVDVAAAVALGGSLWFAFLI